LEKRNEDRRNEMKLFQTLSVLIGMLFLLSAIPAMAQTETQVTFDAPFAFYAGDSELPAGSYTMIPDDSTNVLLIKSDDGSRSAYVEYEVVDSDTPPSDTEITFNKYGNSDFLNGITVKGEESTMRILPSRSEQDSAKTAVAKQHSLSVGDGR
jgi:hypothetical protein